MRTLITLGLALALVACGASAPIPAPDDASTSDDGGSGCPPRNAAIAGMCISESDDACGPRRLVCPRGTWCVVESGLSRDPVPEDVHCDRMP